MNKNDCELRLMRATKIVTHRHSLGKTKNSVLDKIPGLATFLANFAPNLLNFREFFRHFRALAYL